MHSVRVFRRISRFSRVTMRIVLTVAAFLVPGSFASAGGAQLPGDLIRGGVLYHAVYYTADGSKWLHVEIVRDVSGRTLRALGNFAVPTVDICRQGGSGKCEFEPADPEMMDTAAAFAVYYGVDYDYKNLQIPIMEKALAIEDVSGKVRTLEVLRETATPSNACLAPKCCLCGTIQNCCSCVTCPR